MTTQKESSSLRRWHEMNPREQLVWASCYAIRSDSITSALDSALAADKTIVELRRLDLDDLASSRPEFEIARVGLNISYAEFVPWFRIALRITRVGRAGIGGYEEVTEKECREAFDVYAQSVSDFY